MIERVVGVMKLGFMGIEGTTHLSSGCIMKVVQLGSSGDSQPIGQ